MTIISPLHISKLNKNEKEGKEIFGSETPRIEISKVNEVDPNNHQIGSALYISSHLCAFSFLPFFLLLLSKNIPHFSFLPLEIYNL